MIRNTISVSKPMHLSTQNGQIIFENKQSRERKSRPIEDLGYLILEHPQITLTQILLQQLSFQNVSVVFCGQNYQPTSMLFHLHTNSVQNERYRAQLSASLPLQKRLWGQTVQAKVRNQAQVLKALNLPSDGLFSWANQVQSGDTSFIEAQAARMYWKHLFGDSFVRTRGGDAPNNALNYGYAILRAATARALSGAGLLPTWGIHHRNKYNDFCLADDIMEPYRPFVDALVIQMLNEFDQVDELTTEHKRYLLEVLKLDTFWTRKVSPMQVSLHKTAVGLWQCFEGTKRSIPYPNFLTPNA